MLRQVSTVLGLAAVAFGQAAIYQQCGGTGWAGATTCASGSVCTSLNSYYSQCLPGTPAPASSVHVSSASATHPLSSTAPASAPSSTPVPAGTLPRLGGVNTAGYDFSVATNGSFTGTGVTPPPAQFAHFTSEGVNLYRIPFAWQLMTPTLGGSIDQNFLARYDATVQAALNSGPNVHVIIDVHNYARWNGQIISQGGPSNAQFSSLWTQLAAKYGNNDRIIFGIMNEPHDIPSVELWAETLQDVVCSIREAGGNNYLLLPGSSWASAQAFPTEAGPLLVQIADPLGGTDRLIFDVHKYLDSDNSGTHAECTTDNVAVLQTLVTFLQQNGNRQAILSETGGGNTASCETLLDSELSYVKSAYPTIAGFAVWSAGAFASSYVLSVTPNGNIDQPIWIYAVEPNLP